MIAVFVDQDGHVFIDQLDYDRPSIRLPQRIRGSDLTRMRKEFPNTPDKSYRTVQYDCKEQLFEGVYLYLERI